MVDIASWGEGFGLADAWETINLHALAIPASQSLPPWFDTESMFQALVTLVASNVRQQSLRPGLTDLDSTWLHYV